MNRATQMAISQQTDQIFFLPLVCVLLAWLDHRGGMKLEA